MKCHAKKMIRIERRLPSLSQRSVCAQLFGLVIILCQADQIGRQENVNSCRMSLEIHINNGFTVVLLTSREDGAVTIHLQKHVFMKAISKDALLGTEIREYIAARTARYPPLTSTEMSAC